MLKAQQLTNNQFNDEHYVSIDSAPPEYAISRHPLICICSLFAFSILIAVLLSIHDELAYFYALALHAVSGNFLEVPNTLHFRIFFLAFALSFWLCVAGNWTNKLLLLLFMSIWSMAVIFAIDLLLLEFNKVGGFSPFSLTGNIISGYAALITIGIVFFTFLKLPDGISVNTKLHKAPTDLITLVVAISISAFIITILFHFASHYIEFLRGIALLGGLGPGLFLFSPILIWVTFIIGTWRRHTKQKGNEKPSVAFLVAALNESTHIADCIRSLDEASAKYEGITKLYLVDNGSNDNTPAIAKNQLYQCRALKGDVLICPIPGKARALNYGLQSAKEDIIVRVDADTIVDPTLLSKLIPHFSDPTVGGVGGIPFPKDSSFLIAKMRLIEVYYNIAFQRVGQTAIEAVNVIPGIMSAYRREIIVELGGFVEGINGEDTDMTIRVGRLGYRILIDPNIILYSEVPFTLRHLREQRLRWSRGFFHVFARNKSCILMRQGARGLWGFPMAFVAVFRRIIVVPILIFAGLVAILDPNTLFLRQGAAIGAVVVGPALFMTSSVLLVHRRIDLIPYIPAYLLFRLFRAYIAYESLFTFVLKKKVTTGHIKNLKQLQTQDVIAK